MSIDKKATKGNWSAHNHLIFAEGTTGAIGQAYLQKIATTNKKSDRDSEGLTNAQLFAASKDMYMALKKVRQDFINSGCSDQEWMGRRMNEISAIFEKHNITP